MERTVHALETARSLGHTRLWIQGDPNAEGFCLAVGAVKLRDIPSSVPGRTIPPLEKELA